MEEMGEVKCIVGYKEEGGALWRRSGATVEAEGTGAIRLPMTLAVEWNAYR